jgi:hypothetical protein
MNRDDRDEREPEEHEEELAKIGSLAQSARLKHLNSARWTLIVIGVLTVLLNGYLLISARDHLVGELRKQNINMANVNREEFEHVLMRLRFVDGVAITIGAIFIVLGLLVKVYPVPITITALALYVVATLGFGVLAPETLAQGLIIKIIVILALVKAIQAAFAYQRDLAVTAYE